MKKKLFASIIASVCAFCCAFGLAACNSHDHDYAEKYSYNSEYHWRQCSRCKDKLDYGKHVMEGDKCGVCDYKVEHGTSGDDPKDPNKPDTPDTPNPPVTDTGDSAFKGVSVSAGGVLSWNKIKGASKYVITVTYSGSSSPISYDIDKSKTSQDLSALRQEGFPVGKSQVTVTAYSMQSETVDGEKIEAELPISGVEDSLRVTKLNGAYTFTRLKYIDNFVTLDGFYSDKAVGDDGKQYYLYELALENNQNTQLNLTNKVRVATGGSVAFYRSESDRLNDTNAISSTEIRIMRFAHGENKLYLRVTEGGNAHDYDLCVYGLYSVNIERYNATPNLDDGGYRVYDYQEIGLATTITERDIIAQAALYDGVQSGAIGRDASYKVIEKADYTLTLPSSYNANVPVKLYFYDENTLRADCAEYGEYSKYYGIDDNANGNNMTLSSSGSMVTGAVVVPYTIAGKRISATSFFMTDAISIEIEEGTTEFSVTFNYCSKLTDIWLPSTINYMGERALGNNSLDTLPQNLIIHCAFDASHASSFHYNWNGIAGTTKKFNTVYGDTAPVIADGISYKIENGALIVIGVGEGFDGVIPATATVRRREYNVTTVASIDYDGEITIGKNVTSIYDGAFSGAVGKITVDESNTYLAVQNGLLFADGMSRIVVAQKNFGEAEVSNNVYAIDKNAFTGCDGGSLYFAANRDSFGDWDKSDINVVLGVAQVATENGFKILIKTDGSAVIAAYLGNVNATTITLPSEASGHEITSILTGLLKNCKSVTELFVPFVGEAKDSSGRTDLKCLFGDSVPETLTKVKVGGGTIAPNAFEDCTNLQYNQSGGGCYIGTESNPYYALIKPISADITELTVNAQTKVIVRGALDGCANLDTLSVPFVGCVPNDENGTVGDIFCKDAVHDYGGKCNDFVPQSLKAVTINGNAYSDAFVGCNGIQRITIGADVDHIASDAFGVGANKMASLAEIACPDNSLYTVVSGILYGYGGSRILFVPKAISGEITIGAGITEIAANTFAGCMGITAMTVPATVTSIGQNAFSGCTGLRSLTLPFVGKTADATDNEAKLEYVLGKTGNGMLNSLTITGGTKARGIGDALGSNNYLGTLVLPATLTELGSTLNGCTFLENITVPFVGVTDIVPTDSDPKQFGCIFGFKYTGGKNVPNVPSYLKSITVLTGDTIENRYFDNCDSVTTLIIPDTCTSVDINKYVSNLTGLQYKEYDNGKYLDSVSTPYYILCGVKDKTATSLSVHPNTRILANASECKIESIVFEGENITHIATQALAQTNLTGIVIPDSVIYLGWGALGDCRYLTSVTIGTGVKYISGELLEHWNEQNMEVTSVVFKNPNGWSANGQSLSSDMLSDPQQAAQYLMSCWGNSNNTILTRE